MPMKKHRVDNEGISEVISVILIISMLLVIAILVYAMFFGQIGLKPTSRIAANAETVKIPLDMSTSTQIPYITPMSGDKYSLLGQSNLPSNYPVAYFILRDPDGNSYDVAPSSLSATANTYGTSLYLYKDRLNNYWVTDSLSSIKSTASTQLRPFSQGEWTVVMIDKTADVILDEMRVKIKGDSATNNMYLPNYTLCFTGVCGATGTGIANSSYNVAMSDSTGPGGMWAYTFNGINSNATIPNNPDLTFTGDMSISAWIKPDTTGTTTDSWHTVVGKGQILGGVENDNYQLVTIGNDLYFEWTDPSGQNYHVSTTLNPDQPLENNQWGYVTVVVNGGTAGGVSLYNDGQPVNVNYYSNNHPNPWEGTPMVTPPVVNLRSNNLPVNIGVQADPNNPYHYEGDIGSLAVYNRALSAAEIQQNNNLYLA
jgi:hypothetical protein